MTVDSAATFFVASILTGFGAIIIALIILALNNLFSRFWKPIRWNVYVPFVPTEEPRIEPTVNTANTEIQSARR
jgi:glutamate racemase